MAHTLILALERQRQADLCDFEANLVYRASSRNIRGCYTENPHLEKQNKTTTKIVLVLV